MSFLPLSGLLSEGRDSGALVASVDGSDVDFATFSHDVACNTDRLLKLGCRRGLLAAKDCYWAAVGLMALHHAGATVILPQNLRPGGYDRWGADCVLSDSPPPDGETSTPLHYRLHSGGTPAGLSKLDPGSTLLELFTAGSTGEPKRVTKTLADMEGEAWEIHSTLGAALVPAAVYSTVPYHHLYGLSFRLAWPLSAGWQIIGRTYESWGSLAAELRPNAVLVTSPAHLTRIPASQSVAGLKLQMILSAGAPVSDQTAAEAAAILGLPITDIYGSTETGIIAYRRRIAPGRAWRPFPNVQTRRLQDGRLAVRSPYMSREATDGWFETADLALCAEDGSFQLQGRVDQVVKIEGHRVSLSELVQKLRESALVQEAEVVALKTQPASLGAAVALTDAGRRDLAAIGEFRLGRRLRGELAHTLEPSILPRRWRFVDRLPEAILGKRRREDIEALFESKAQPEEPELTNLRRIEAGIELELTIPADLRQVSGHFRNMPIVPGVAQIDWVVKYAVEYLDAPVEIGKEFQIKFRRVTTAPSVVTLTLVDQLSLKQIAFEYRQDQTVLTLGSLKYEARE